MNHVSLIGNLTRAPERRSAKSDRVVAAMRVAIPRPRVKGKDRGAEFVDVTAFDVTAENCLRYLDKGRKVAIDGRLHHSEYLGDNGRQQRLEVIADSVDFLSRPPRDDVSPAEDERREAVAVGGEDAEDIPF